MNSLPDMDQHPHTSFGRLMEAHGKSPLAGDDPLQWQHQQQSGIGCLDMTENVPGHHSLAHAHGTEDLGLNNLNKSYPMTFSPEMGMRSGHQISIRDMSSGVSSAAISSESTDPASSIVDGNRSPALPVTMDPSRLAKTEQATMSLKPMVEMLMIDTRDSGSSRSQRSRRSKALKEPAIKPKRNVFSARKRRRRSAGNAPGSAGKGTAMAEGSSDSRTSESTHPGDEVDSDSPRSNAAVFSGESGGDQPGVGRDASNASVSDSSPSSGPIPSELRTPVPRSKSSKKSKINGDDVPPLVENLMSSFSSIDRSSVEGSSGRRESGSEDEDDNANTLMMLNASKHAKKWRSEEDELLRAAVRRHGGKNWKIIAEEVPGRNHFQCLQRWEKALRPGLVKGHWSPEEDSLLLSIVKASVVSNWGVVAAQIEGRTAKQCRERWISYLDPAIKKDNWTEEEDLLLQALYAKFGGKWSEISELLPGRSENSSKLRMRSIISSANRKWSLEEDKILIRARWAHRSKWELISPQLPRRRTNACKYRWKELITLDPSIANDMGDEDVIPANSKIHTLHRVVVLPEINVDELRERAREYQQRMSMTNPLQPKSVSVVSESVERGRKRKPVSDSDESMPASKQRRRTLFSSEPVAAPIENKLQSLFNHQFPAAAAPAMMKMHVDPRVVRDEAAADSNWIMCSPHQRPATFVSNSQKRAIGSPVTASACMSYQDRFETYAASPMRYIQSPVRGPALQFRETPNSPEMPLNRIQSVVPNDGYSIGDMYHSGAAYADASAPQMYPDDNNFGARDEFDEGTYFHHDEANAWHDQHHHQQQQQQEQYLQHSLGNTVAELPQPLPAFSRQPILFDDSADLTPISNIFDRVRNPPSPMLSPTGGSGTIRMKMYNFDMSGYNSGLFPTPELYENGGVDQFGNAAAEFSLPGAVLSPSYNNNS